MVQVLSYWKMSVCSHKWLMFKLLPVLSGVPQGSILGPLLFLVHINDLFSSVQFSHTMSFTNDTKCFKLIHKDQETQQLQQDLESLAK